MSKMKSKNQDVDAPNCWSQPWHEKTGAKPDSYIKIYLNEARELAESLETEAKMVGVPPGLVEAIQRTKESRGFSYCCIVNGVPLRTVSDGNLIADIHKSIESLSGQLRSANKLKNAGDDVEASLARISSTMMGIAKEISIISGAGLPVRHCSICSMSMWHA